MGISKAEAAHRAASDLEQVAWVDENDNLLGALPRAELRERGLIGRCTFILLFNGAGQRRFIHLDLLVPSAWSVRQAHDVADEVEEAIAKAVSGAVVSTHIEPIDAPAEG